jgi:hypothetical protein
MACTFLAPRSDGRLIAKEEMAYKNVGDAATILRMYDPKQEEEYIEAGVSAGQSPEEILPDTNADQGFLDMLMESDAVPAAEDCRGKTPTLFENDLAFVRAAFDEVKSSDGELQLPDFHPQLPSLTFTAPEDLWHRCQYLPREALPKGRHFELTTDRERVQKAIADARRRAKEGESSWPKEQLLWELHPVMQWLLDKVMCRFQRHESPIILVPKLGKAHFAYLFQGVLSNKRSQPVVVDWFAVHHRANAPLSVASFEELLAQTGFDKSIANLGNDSSLADLAQEKLQEAVQVARQHMLGLSQERTHGLRQRIDEDNLRFAQWYRRRQHQIQQYKERHRIEGTGRLPRDKEERAKRMTQDMELRQDQRRKWLSDTYEVAGAPYLKLAAVFVGE